MESEEIMLEKKSKSGYKTVDLKKSIKNYSLSEKCDFAELEIVLSAGSTDNANPNLIIKALEMLRAKNFTPILRERIYIILIWNYLDKLCLHLQFAMQIHTKQFFNGGIDKEFEKLEDEISAKFLEYIKLYSKL